MARLPPSGAIPYPLVAVSKPSQSFPGHWSRSILILMILMLRVKDIITFSQLHQLINTGM
jgi:hypothetical protein